MQPFSAFICIIVLIFTNYTAIVLIVITVHRAVIKNWEFRRHLGKLLHVHLYVIQVVASLSHFARLIGQSHRISGSLERRQRPCRVGRANTRSFIVVVERESQVWTSASTDRQRRHACRVPTWQARHCWWSLKLSNQLRICKERFSKAESPLVQYVVDLLYSKLYNKPTTNRTNGDWAKKTTFSAVFTNL